MTRLGSALLLVVLGGCTQNLNASLGTLKNPWGTLDRPYAMAPDERVNPFVATNYTILLEAADPGSRPDGEAMSRYLTAGFALSDFYCEQFFRDADESQRRRRFGRAVTNDVGTAMAAVLGLANAGENVVTAAATSFGLADNLWRNYDDAFVVAADLSAVKSLVYAAQDNFRQKTLETETGLPKQYGTAQSVILRYANFCSTLGMKSLLNQSAVQQKNELDAETEREDASSRETPTATVTGQAGSEGEPAEPTAGSIRIPTEPE